VSAGALGVTIRPLFAALAKAATARSISPASRTLTGLTSGNLERRKPIN
jgi:hypothetical protein